MDCLQKLFSKIEKNEKICMLCGLVFGLLTHMYMMTNKIPNWDDLANFNSYGVGGEFGRWALKMVDKLTLKHSNPWVNGLFAIVLLSITCVLIYRMLHFDSVVTAVLIPLMFMTFPGLTCTMTYMFTVDLYAVGILLTVIAAYLITRRKLVTTILAFACLVFSMGIYQSYICFAITIILLYMLMELVRPKEYGRGEMEQWTTREFIKKIVLEGLLYVLFLGGSTLLYIGCAYWKYPGLGKENYNGVGEMGKISLSRIPRLIVKAYYHFARYFVLGDYSFISVVWRITNIVVVLLMLTAWICIVSKIAKNKIQLFFACLVTVFLPLGNSFVDIMAPDANMSMLMIYQYCLVYVAFLLLLEKMPEQDTKKWVQAVAVAGALAVCLIGYKQFQLAGEVYQRMEMSYDRAYAYLERIIMRVEMMDGYEEEVPVRILGSYSYELNEMQDMQSAKFKDLTGVAMENGLLTPGARDRFVAYYLGKKVQSSVANKDKYLESEEYKNMDIYPQGDCIKKIDDCWVVKLSD